MRCSTSKLGIKLLIKNLYMIPQNNYDWQKYRGCWARPTVSNWKIENWRIHEK